MGVGQVKNLDILLRKGRTMNLPDDAIGENSKIVTCGDKIAVSIK